MSHIRFSRALLFVALAVAMILPTTAAARVRIGVGIGVYSAPYYPYYYGPWGYPYYGYGYYPSYGYGYRYAPYYGYGYGYGPRYYRGYDRPTGELRIKSPVPSAQIFINGSYAGRAADLKSIRLAQGTYNIEQRVGTDIQRERLYIIADRSLTLEFDPPGIPHYHHYDYSDHDRD